MQINEDVKNWLKEASFAMTPVKLDLGKGEEAVILVKSTKDVINSLKGAKAPVRIGWVVLPTGKGPVACLCLNAESAGVGSIFAESFLDPVADTDYSLIQSIGGQERVKAAFFDEEMEMLWAPDVEFGAIERLLAEQAADRADELAERAMLFNLELDFQEAVQFFQTEMPLEKLLEIVRSTACY